MFSSAEKVGASSLPISGFVPLSHPTLLILNVLTGKTLDCNSNVKAYRSEDAFGDHPPYLILQRKKINSGLLKVECTIS